MRSMGSDIDEVLLVLDGSFGGLWFKVGKVEDVNGRKRVTLTVTKGVESKETLFDGDSFNLNLNK
jgi:hypothetical protein